MAETNKEVFYQVVSGNKTLPVYDVDAHRRIAAATASVDELSGKVIGLSGEYGTFSGAISGKVSGLSGEFKDFVTQTNQEFINTSSWANQTFQPAGDYVSASDFTAFQQQVEDALDTKVDKSTYNDFVEEARAWDNEFYTAGADIEISGHEISVKSDFVRLPYLQANYYDKDTVDEKIANFGGFQKASPKGADNHPDVDEPRTNIIYLVKVGTSEKDPYYEWIYDAVNGWECIGEMSVPLAGYYTKIEADARFQPVGDYVSASDLNNYYTKTEVDDLIEPFTTSAEVEEMVDELADEVNEALSGLYNTEVVAGYGIQVETTTDPQTGDKTFEISTDPNVLDYGLFNTYGTQRYASSTLDLEFVNNGDIQGENITLNTTTHQVVLAPGSYHIDIQVDATLDASTTLSNDYFVAVLTAGPQPERSVKMSVDASYPHTETFTLSYDLVIDGDTAQTLSLTMNNLPVGTNVYAKMNIHQILTLQAAAEAISNNYRAGNGMALENNTFSVKNGNGLEFTNDGSLQLKLGDGLAFTNEGGVEALTINTDVGNVVTTVENLKDAIDTKITTNYPPTMITDSHGQVMGGTQYSPGNGGCLYGTLFNTSITHPIMIDKTLIGIYSYTDNIEAILGIYEYQPNYDRGNGDIGRTVALCDTGIVLIKKGFNEFPVKHINTAIDSYTGELETTPEMKTNCMYYATIYLGYKSSHGANDLQVACAPGYAPQYGNIKPALSMANVNNIHANIENNDASYDADLSFNDMGFNWQYTSYPDKSTAASSQYFEACSAPRMYMQIRNKK